MEVRNRLITIAVYFFVLSGALALATVGARVQGQQTSRPAATPQASPKPVKPRFTLSTSRAYNTDEKTRIWVSYQDVEALDFRVYQVNDPVRFFKQLNDPHQMGREDQDEVAEVAEAVEHKPTALEKLRAFKASVYRSVKNYFRGQLRRESRTAFNDKFRSGEQLPLNVADYARVPLLNSSQLTIRGAWRQVLAPLDREYDSRMIPLGRREPGVYLIEAVNGDLRAYTIAVVTDLTMINKTSDDGQMLVYVVNRKTGEPRDDAQVEVVRSKKTIANGKTNRDGILKVKLPREKPAAGTAQNAQDAQAAQDTEAEPLEEVRRQPVLVMARQGDQFAISDLDSMYFGGEEGVDGDYEGGSGVIGELASYIYTDRPVYRPNQIVYFKGILRVMGEAGYELPVQRTVQLQVTDPADGKLLDREVTLTARGTFSGEIEVPAAAPLGSYSIVAKIGNREARGYFEVAEYKKPEYKVRVTTPRAFVPVGDKTKFSVEAKYFFGAPVANADVHYYIYRSRYYHPWWRGEGEDDGLGAGDEAEDEGDSYGYGDDMVKEGTGRLDAQGRLDIAFDVPPSEPKQPHDFEYRIEAQVSDSSRREMAGRVSFVGTRGSAVAHAEVESYVVYEGDNARIKVRTSDYEGRPVSTKVALKFVKREWERVDKGGDDKWSRYEYKLRERDLGGGEVTTNAQGQADFSWLVPITGSVKIETILRENGREVISEGGYLWAADRNNRWSDFAATDSMSIKLVPDKKSYKPGETAHVLAMLPTDGAHLLATVELNSVMKEWRVDAAGRAVMIDVPIEARHAPNVYLTVCYVKEGEMYTSDKSLSVPARDKFLKLEVIPDKKQYKPREAAAYTLIARNADGSVAPGVEVSLGVVDEAIYSVRPETAGDIRRAFYGRRYNRVGTSFSSAFTFTGYSGAKKFDLAVSKRAYQLADFKNENQLAEAKIRKEFKDTAFWQADAVTGADGKAQVKLNLPDNLTTWRATARAVTADLRVAANVGRVLSRKDLILRLETPRFMTEGDTVTVSGIVHNYLDAEKAAQVELEVTGAKLLDAARQTVTVAKNGEQRIDWRIAASQVGQVTLLATAKTNAESDGIELPVPVVPLGLKQTKGAAAAMSEDTAEKSFTLDLPANANTTARTLRIEAAPSIAGAMFGALDYLTSFPYGCTEQTMSSFLPNVIVAQTLKDVKTVSVRSTADLGKKVQKGLDRLYSLQHGDGGWGWWKDDKTDPFMTAYVVDGLAMAARAGYGIQNYTLDQGRERVKQLLDAGKVDDKPLDPESRAYLVYAYTVSGDADARYVNDLFGRRNDLQPYGKTLLALSLKQINDAGRARQVTDELERLARGDDFGSYWESKRRPMLDFTEANDLEATAMAIKALARVNPQSPLLPKAARWLTGTRRNGYYWDTTKHTAFAIYALTEYLKVSRELSPDYAVEIYLNNESVLSKRISAAEAASGQSFVIERKGAQLGGANQIRVVKRGAGVLYASATLDYFTKEENTPAQSSRDLRITREYLRLVVTETNGKPRWTTEALTGEVRSGDLIISRLHVMGARSQYLMIEDPIPAGCEQLERVGGIDLNYTTRNWCDWYSNREFRDNRTVFFRDFFPGDSFFQYAMRVQVPGEFKAGPARAELMYQPTVQANTENRKLTILDKN
jgi:uncharacterized protein YfaS (alpha-2-macroglobulin family)